MYDFLKSKKIVYSLVVLLIGIILLAPMADYQPLLSQGDHGRDFYAANQSSKGDLAYQDYWWVYGPIMPQYYSVFYKFLGKSIQSIIIGKLVIVLLAGLFFYLILTTVVPPSFAALGGIWYYVFNQDFFFTFNHIGGSMMSLCICWLIFLYTKEQKKAYLHWALLSIFLLSLIKVNFGIMALSAFVFLFSLIDRLRGNSSSKKFIYLISCLVVPLLIVVTYYIAVRGLSIYEIRQCLPYLQSDHPYNATPFDALKELANGIFFNIRAHTTNMIFAFIVILSTGYSLSLLLNKNTSKEEKINLSLIFIIPITFYILFLHEFLMSGVFYRSFWSKPFSILLVFIVLGTPLSKFSKIIKILVYSVIILILSLEIPSRIMTIQKAKHPSQYLPFKQAQIYVGNSPEWINTVNSTTQYLKENLKGDELFFALPYDALYYYLTDKKSPTRQLIFFEHINISPEQEKSIIQELKKNNVNWILVSSRKVSGEQGLGILGETYCPLIAKYISENFLPTARFGDWENHPGWAWNHGTLIYKHK